MMWRFEKQRRAPSISAYPQKMANSRDGEGRGPWHAAVHRGHEVSDTTLWLTTAMLSIHPWCGQHSLNSSETLYERQHLLPTLSLRLKPSLSSLLWVWCSCQHSALNSVGSNTFEDKQKMKPISGTYLCLPHIFPFLFSLQYCETTSIFLDIQVVRLYFIKAPFLCMVSYFGSRLGIEEM